MSKLSDKQAANLAKIEEARNQAETILSDQGLLVDIVPIVVPIGYAVSFVKAAGSALSDAQAEALAESRNIELFTAETA